MKLYKPGPSIHTYELCYCLNEKEIDCIARVSEKNFDTERYGVRVRFNPKSGWVYIKINPLKLVSTNCSAAEIIVPNKQMIKRSIENLEVVLKKIGLPNEFSAYEVTRIDACVNIWAKRNSDVREYLRLQKKRKLIGGTAEKPFYDDRLSPAENLIFGHDYYRAGAAKNNNGEDIVFYDKKRQAKRFNLNGADELPKGILRIERQLDRTTLRNIQKKRKLSKENLLFWVAEHSGELILERLRHYFDPGDFHKINTLFQTIDST